MRQTRLALLLLALAAPAGADTRVIALQHADAEALVPVVQPLLGPWESVSAYGRSLVVNAAPATLERVNALVADLDRPLRQLRISLRRAVPARDTGDDGATASRISTRPREDIQQIQGAETAPLLLQRGRLVPLPAGGLLGPDILWETLEEGIAVNARVNGELVTLELEVRDDRSRDGTVNRATLRSSLQGRLGEWILLGGSAGEPRPAELTGTRRREDPGYEVKVELAP